MMQKQELVIKYFQQGMSKRAIAKSMNLHRDTVTRHLNEYQKERGSPDAGVVNPPKYDCSSRKKIKLTEEVCVLIGEYLRENQRKRATGLAKQCMAGTDMHEALLKLGYQISNSSVCRHIRQHKRLSSEVYIKQHTIPGRVAEFDWGEVQLKVGDKVKRCMMAVFTLAHSNYRWAYMFYRQDMPSFLWAHVLFFQHIKGVVAQVVYDNMKVAVAKCTIRQSDKKPTEDLLKLCTYYQYDYRFCNVGKGNEKGNVEKSVEYVRRKAFCDLYQFDTLDQANAHLADKLNELNNRTAKGQQATISEQLSDEQSYLVPLPSVGYEVGIMLWCKVDKYRTIQVDRNHYSVPETIVASMVQIKVLPLQIKIHDSKGHVVATHERQHAIGQWIIDIDHYWKSLKTKPGALPMSVGMQQADPLIKKVYHQFFSDQNRDFIEIMLFCRQNNVSSQDLEKVMLECQQIFLNSPHTADRVIHLLNRSGQVQEPHTSINADSMSSAIAQQCRQQLADIQNLLC